MHQAVQCYEGTRWILRADLNGVMEEECWRQQSRLFQTERKWCLTEDDSLIRTQYSLLLRADMMWLIRTQYSLLHRADMLWLIRTQYILLHRADMLWWLPWYQLCAQMVSTFHWCKLVQVSASLQVLLESVLEEVIENIQGLVSTPLSQNHGP